MGIEPRLLSTYDTASVAETNTGTKKDKYVSPFVLKRAISEGIVGAESNTNKVSSISISSTDVQYPTAKLVYDQLAAKQATLVSDTNIKTVNSATLLGSGDVAVQAIITGAATTIDTENLTVSRALVSDGSGKVAVSDVTATELGYVDGVNSAIQPQLDLKAGITAVTGALQLPVGTTAQRPVTPTTGMIRDNTAIGLLEWYDGTEWNSIREEQFIGISYDTSTETMTRIGVNSTTAIGTMLPKNSPVLRNIERVLLSDAGVELNQISWTDKTKDIYGATVDRSGASGQVMTRLPKVYFSSSVVGTVYTLKFSEYELPGFSVWPGFENYSKMYMGAYEASLASTKWASAADPVGGTIFPQTNKTSSEQDAYAVARGSGWMQENLPISTLFRTICLIAWVLTILGNGLVQVQRVRV